MLYDSAKSKEDPDNEEQEVRMEDRPPARHKLPQTMSYPYAKEPRVSALKRGAAVAGEENVIEEKWVTPEQMLEDLLYTPVASPGINREYEENILPYSCRFAKDLKLPRRADDRYLSELKAMRCLELSSFNDTMFTTRFGRMVNMVRPWESKLWNLKNSFRLSRLSFDYRYESETGLMSLLVKGDIFAQAIGTTRRRARKNVARIAWDILRHETITIFLKPMAIAYNQIFTVNDVIARPIEVFQTWFRASIPTNLGANWQGIVEPIRPNARVVIRRGKQSPDFTLETWQAAFITLMERYIIADTMDMDLIFNSDFTEEERTMMYQTARSLGLVTRSTECNGYSSLLVKRRFDPFTIARRVIAKGGDTPKYQAFVPTGVRFL